MTKKKKIEDGSRKIEIMHASIWGFQVIWTQNSLTTKRIYFTREKKKELHK